MNERQKGFCQFVVTRGDTPEMFDSRKEAFDQIAVSVEMVIETALGKTIGAWRNDSLRARRLDLGNEVVGVVALVPDDGLCREMLDGLGGKIDVGNLTGRENHPQGISQGVDHHVQFGRQSAPRTAWSSRSIFRPILTPHKSQDMTIFPLL